MAEEKSTALVISRFEHGKQPYRLLAKGKWSAGYEDEYILEAAHIDNLGDRRWDHVNTWSKVDHYGRVQLVEAIKAAQREQRGDVVEKIAAFVATFPDGLAIADAIREGRFE